METKRFYDVHMHTVDLSHANLMAFMERILRDGLLKKIIKLIFFKILGIFKKKHNNEPFIEKSMNLLTFMESSVKNSYLVLEYYLKNKDIVVGEDNTFSIGKNEYNKIVLCPMIMDFGNKSIKHENNFYNMPANKPVTDQIKDVFLAIQTYYDHIAVHPASGADRIKYEKTKLPKNKRLFEIYPFMGLNTENYSIDEIRDMLNKYFGDFSDNETAEERQEKLYRAMGTFSGNLENRSECRNIFAGIKVYPPLGFDPWPEAGQKASGSVKKRKKVEREKVAFLYKTCQEKRIPIMTHCSKGGFIVERDAKNMTDPGKQWRKVLKEYSDLTLCFAHYGKNKKWDNTISDYIAEDKYRNVYADISCNPGTAKYYRNLSKYIERNAALNDKLLFGSDFLMNLMSYRSYNEYLKIFSVTDALETESKHRMGHINIEQFLFGR